MSRHYSVLLSECLEGLAIRADGIYVDGTLGRGGHSAQILQRIPKGYLYAFDRDETAIKESKERLLSIASNFTLIHNQFSMLKEELSNRGIYQIDGMLLDLGIFTTI